jgi:hypothetical protein
MGREVTNLVECHSGYQYAEKPTAVHWEGQRIEIMALEAEWRTPAGRFFKVRCGGERRFELLYSESNDDWTVRPI